MSQTQTPRRARNREFLLSSFWRRFRTDRRCLRRADRMAADGDFLRAIDFLTEANRTLASPAVESRLVELRHEAFAQVKDAPGRDTWPPDFDDPFEGAEGAVEVDAGDLTVEVLGGAIQHHGCLVVRGLLSRPDVDQLVHSIDEALRAQQASVDGAPVSETAPWFQPLEVRDEPAGRKELPLDLHRVFLVNSPRAMYRVAEAFRAANLDRVVGEYLGERPILTEMKWHIWRMTRSGDVYSFHQERSVFDYGEDRTINHRTEPFRALNVWIALSPCGETAPSLQFYPFRTREVFEPDQLIGLKPETLDRVTRGCAVAAPVYQPGDAVLFDEYLLHRTKSDATMSEPRYSIESWMFSASGYPARGGRQVVL